jgi:hypothetical protein
MTQSFMIVRFSLAISAVLSSGGCSRNGSSPPDLPGMTSSQAGTGAEEHAQASQALVARAMPEMKRVERCESISM